MSQTPPEVLKSSTAAAEPADQLTISREQDAFRLELRGQSGNGTVGVVKREELQRILHTPFRVWPRWVSCGYAWKISLNRCSPSLSMWSHLVSLWAVG
jgi:hypothetical protein